MTQIVRWMKTVLATVLTVAVIAVAPARAAELPMASSSPLTGVAFDDKPLVLPAQRNFQMAMLMAGSEMGRTCGNMEVYGWRMSQTEQGRVNQIFNNAVDRLRLLGYTITPQALKSISKDITLFTADRSDKHFIFLWSAGELGLVLNLCETTAAAASAAHANGAPAVGVFSMPMDSMPAKGLSASAKTSSKTSSLDSFSPVGEWTGNYTCAQGYSGATLKVGPLRGRDFEGVFKFYPTEKNLSAATGSYEVRGQYDKETKRILINPGRWLKHPPGFFNTIMVGSFDSVRNTFSAYFQGVTGCTSFEARREVFYDTPRAQKKAKPAKHKQPKKKQEPSASNNPFIPTVESLAPLGSVASPTKADEKREPVGIDLSPKATVPLIMSPSAVPVITPPAAPAPSPAPAKK